MDISVLRNMVIRYGAKLDMRPNQQVCLWHLLDHDFKGKGYVFPSESTIAERMGLESDRQVRRIIDEIESKKYISVKRTLGFSNRYSFKGIVKAVLPYWQEEIKKERERLKNNTQDKNVLSEQDNPGQKSPQPRTKVSAPPGQKCPPKHCNRSTANKHEGEATKNGDKKISPPDSPSSEIEHQKQVPNRYTSEWDMWKIEQGETIYQKYFERRPHFSEKDLTSFLRLRGDGITVAQITKSYDEFCRTENSWYAKRGYAFHVFAEDVNAFGNEKIKSIITKVEKMGNRKNGATTKNVEVEDLGERTLREFGLV